LPTETVVPVKLIGGLGSLVEQLDTGPAIVFPDGAVAGAGGIAVVVIMDVVSPAVVLLVVNVLVLVLLPTVLLGVLVVPHPATTNAVTPAVRMYLVKLMAVTVPPRDDAVAADSERLTPSQGPTRADRVGVPGYRNILVIPARTCPYPLVRS
jgi:hypothetical protein